MSIRVSFTVYLYAYQGFLHCLIVCIAGVLLQSTCIVYISGFLPLSTCIHSGVSFLIYLNSMPIEFPLLSTCVLSSVSSQKSTCMNKEFPLQSTLMPSRVPLPSFHLYEYQGILQSLLVCIAGVLLLECLVGFPPKSSCMHIKGFLCSQLL